MAHRMRMREILWKNRSIIQPKTSASLQISLLLCREVVLERLRKYHSSNRVSNSHENIPNLTKKEEPHVLFCKPSLPESRNDRSPKHRHRWSPSAIFQRKSPHSLIKTFPLSLPFKTSPKFHSHNDPCTTESNKRPSQKKALGRGRSIGFDEALSRERDRKSDMPGIPRGRALRMIEAPQGRLQQQEPASYAQARKGARAHTSRGMRVWRYICARARGRFICCVYCDCA